MRFISYGGGTQSTAMVLMALEGRMERPDVVIFADTGSEMPSTYRTVAVVEKMCNDEGLQFVTVQKGTLYQDYMDNEIIPVIGNSSCTDNYKIQPIRRWVRANQVEFGPKPWSESWIGITTDERRRKRESDVKWCKNVFPLLDMDMSRQDCIDYITGSYPFLEVTKSGCFHCHYNNSKHWAKLRKNNPTLFDIAFEMEKIARYGQHKMTKGLFQGKSIGMFDYTHQLTDFGIEIYPEDIHCSSSGGCFI